MCSDCEKWRKITTINTALDINTKIDHVTQLTWKLLVACVDGNQPCSWNNCITSCLRCSKTRLWPFSPDESLRLPGVRGVRGDPSQLSKSDGMIVAAKGEKPDETIYV